MAGTVNACVSRFAPFPFVYDPSAEIPSPVNLKYASVKLLDEATNRIPEFTAGDGSVPAAL